MAMGQCVNCGAPIRGRAECRYCGTPAPPAPAAPVAGPAICVCGVLAARRCDHCDTPVCEQHTDKFWPGQNLVEPVTDPDERAVWVYGTRAPAEQIVTADQFHTLAACTDCRARFADGMIDRYRAIPADPDPIRRAFALLDAKVYAPDLISREPGQFVGMLADYLAALNYPTQTVATNWVSVAMNAGVRGRKAVAREQVWVLRFEGATAPLLFLRPSDRMVSMNNIDRMGFASNIVSPAANPMSKRYQEFVQWKSVSAWIDISFGNLDPRISLLLPLRGVQARPAAPPKNKHGLMGRFGSR